MFYSHEVLTSRKYGVATVWLVATIGSKSNLKKVNRKAILDVDVKKACNTIIFPEAPMALRLQSNLLYGVSRVYSQQCGYVLSDAQKAQDAMRNLLRVSKSNELDPDAGKARPEQLMLMDDPAFMPDLALPALDFDLSHLDVGPGESQNSLLSPNSRRRASSTGSSRASSILGLRISNSSGGHSGGTYQLPDINDDPFAAIGSSAQKVPGLNLGGRGLDDEELGLEEVDWEFDDEGNEVAVQRSGTAATFKEKLLSGSAASGAVRREHEEGQAARRGVFDEEGDIDMMLGGEDEFGVPDQNLALDPNAEAFPAGANSRDGIAEEEEFEPSSDSAEARQKKTRKARSKKTIPADMTLVLTRREIKEAADNYLDIMQREAKAKQDRQLKAVAKTNARIWIFGDGIGGIGRGIGEGKTPSPLDMFSGEALLAAITGIPLPPASPQRNGVSPAPDGSDAEGRRVRPRLEAGDEDIDMDAVARGDDIQPIYDDEGMEIEVGREAQSALDDHMSSAMPWNMSGGAKGPSSSIQGGTGGRAYMSGSLRHSSIRGENQYQLGSQVGRGREGSRLTSASPLFGRGSGRDIMSLGHGSDDVNMAAASDHGLDLGPNTQEEEFEIFGPTAQVDTQTAAQPNWIAEALDRESFNFLDFVKNAIISKEKAKSKAAGKGKAVATREEMEDEGVVGFGELIPVGEQSVMVAAQGFLHVLSLATKGLLGVKQAVEEGDGGFGEVKMWVVGGIEEEYGIPGDEDGDEDMGMEGRGGWEGEDVDELAI